MLFNSYIFIFLFLPLCLGGFYFLQYMHRTTAAKLWLVVLSFWFYGYFNLSYLTIMVVSICFNYLVFVGMRHYAENYAGRRKALMVLAVAANLGLLFYFKYFDFFLDNVNHIFGMNLPLKGILLPLGISFFTFQQIGFAVDAYKGEVGECSFLDYALFISFFPQLIAGPIVSYDEMLPQFQGMEKRSFDGDLFGRGVYLFVLGMAKKVLIADALGKAVDFGYANPGTLSGSEAFLVSLFYILQLYFDFSGYCDMAGGLGRMLGIRIMENFNSPYKAADTVEFWRRWHVSLSRFFRKYVYFPLGGSRKGKARMYFLLFLIFFLSGIWHGAGWTYIVWGSTQGLVFVLTRAWQNLRRKSGKAEKKDPALLHGLKVLLHFLFFDLVCVVFRSESLGQAGEMFRRMLTGDWKLPGERLTAWFNLDEFWYVMKLFHLDRLPGSSSYLCYILTAVLLAVVFFAPNSMECAKRMKPGVKTVLVTAVLFVWSVLSFGGVSSFLYFNF